ncbi:hypothetical protein [uncultured Eubacterium sp.]|uniref:hypothetical protein n=1 Tax=uncultured Eubacterium sp. TaxID=165185 RepID=UPI0026143140|nr:hypothetical protein [uncultured Eubacterium sp.]
MNCYGKQGRRCFASKMISSFIAILVLIAVLPMQPIFAYSYDKNYLDYSSWDESNINTVAIDCEGAMGELSGSLNYFTEESSAYFLFNLNESEITENSVISVIFSVSSTQGSYDFTVDNSGVSYNEEAAEKYFDTESKADEFTTGHAIVTVITDIKDKVTTHDFAVKIAVDGRLYNLFDSKPLTIETYLPTTAGKSSSQKTTKKSETKKKSTKSTKSSKSTAKKSSTKSSSSKSGSKKQTTENYESQSDENSADFSGDYLNDDVSYHGKSGFSPMAKAVLIGGLVIIGLGILLFVIAEVVSRAEKRKEKESKNDSKNENKDDTTDDK